MIKYQAKMTTTLIVLEIEIPIKCNFKNFERILKEEYSNRITHDFICSRMGLPEDTWVKLNGTFPRWLELIYTENNLYQFVFLIQTELWKNVDTGKKEYLSIFPCFIKKYCRPCLHTLEHLCCLMGKGEDVLKHINDPEELLSCEDRIARIIKKLEKSCINYPALLNSRYTMAYARPVSVSVFKEESIYVKRFPMLYNLVATARGFFGKRSGVLAMVNTLMRL